MDAFLILKTLCHCVCIAIRVACLCTWVGYSLSPHVKQVLVLSGHNHIAKVLMFQSIMLTTLSSLCFCGRCLCAARIRSYAGQRASWLVFLLNLVSGLETTMVAISRFF